MSFIRTKAGDYLNIATFSEISVKYNKHAELYFVQGWFDETEFYKPPNNFVEIAGFKTQVEAQMWIDEKMDQLVGFQQSPDSYDTGSVI